MGIDAEILVRNVPAATVTDDWLKEKSWQLVRAIGAGKFFINDGLPSPAYAVASKAWHEAFNTHPKYLEWKAAGERNEYDLRREIHDQIFADIGKPPQELRLAIDRTLTRYREDDDPAPGSVYRQDGDDVNAEPGECLLELSLSGRYYGEGYERGDILAYCAIAEWLEINIPGCSVWYGGDSSGVCAQPFHAERRLALRRHLYSERGRDYFNYGGWGGYAKAPPACGLCPGGKYRGQQYGSGGNFSAFSCGGCGKNVCSRDGGKTWAEDKN